ncbi:Bug family tripartite tricarboxylate transporter substrate binding protein [Chloroflexota bacterium]
MLPYIKRELGVEVIIKNVPMNAGKTGTVQFWRSKPDGHTLLFVDVGRRIVDQMVTEINPWDINQFTWIAQIDKSIFGLAVAADSPYYTVEDLQKAGLERPMRLGCSEPNRNEIIPPNALAIPHTFVSGYSGSGAAMLGLIRGECDMVSYSLTSILPLVLGGDLRLIVSYSDERSALLEDSGLDVPSATEIGYPALAPLFGSRSVAAPPGTPAHITAALDKAFYNAINDPGYLAWAEKAKRPVTYANGDEVTNIIAELYGLFSEWQTELKTYVAG